MFKRYELHNHTTQSDAGITCEDLIRIMQADRADVFALTDHNTISGHRIVQRLLAEGKPRVKCLYGMEYTTYYGHILCLNLKDYVPWDSIDRTRPELLFQAVRRTGALAGIAHPFSFGYPFARGCRFDMTIRDFSQVDFIEIFNNPEPLREVNERALNWWEELTLKGERLAVTSGMDLHGAWSMAMQFATYAEGAPAGNPEAEIAVAIRRQQTHVSKGPLLLWRYDEAAGRYLFTIEDMHKPGYVRSGAPYVLTLTSRAGTRGWSMPEDALSLSAEELGPGGVFIPKLYDGEAAIERLVSISPVIRRPRGA